MGAAKSIQHWLRKVAGIHHPGLNDEDEAAMEMAEGLESTLTALPPTKGRLRRPLTKDNFEEKLWGFLTAGDELTAGSVQLVNLMEVHERFTRHWGRIGEMVHMLVQMIISDHLAEDDVYIRLREHSYAIVFPGLPLPEAESKCAYIAAKISHYLLGTPMETSDDRLQSIAFALDEAMLNTGDSLHEAFCQAVEKAENRTAPSPTTGSVGGAAAQPEGPAFVEMAAGEPVADCLLGSDAFEEYLELASADTGAGCVGGMQILDIDAVQQRYEAYWDRIGEQVMTIVQMVIEDHLSKEDRYTKWEGKSFLIYFGKKSPDEAKKVCHRITREITKLLAELDSDADRLAVDHTILDLERTVIVKEEPHLPQIKRLLGEKMSGGVERVKARPPTKIWSSDQADAVPLDISFSYWPVWYVRRSVITTSVCLPAKQMPDGRTRYGHGLLGKQVNLSSLVELDEKTLQRTCEDMSRMFENGRKALIVCPVHYYTLSKPDGRKRYMTVCDNIPEMVKKYLSFEVVGLPGEISPVFTREIVGDLQPYCRSVGAQFPLNRSSFGNLAGTGINLIGADISDQLLPESKIMRLMEQFVSGAEGVKMEAYIRGLHSISLVTSAVGSGFDYIAGPAIQEDSPSPDYVMRFEAEDLFSHLIARQKMEISEAATG
ncbi:MAG: diguanylate cyclase [Alphaproteobacteria bacterium]|nr:diguanylate cyclase [Alphaproteobacteria bacterium]